MKIKLLVLGLLFIATSHSMAVKKHLPLKHICNTYKGVSTEKILKTWESLEDSKWDYYSDDCDSDYEYDCRDYQQPYEEPSQEDDSSEKSSSESDSDSYSWTDEYFDNFDDYYEFVKKHEELDVFELFYYEDSEEEKYDIKFVYSDNKDEGEYYAALFDLKEQRTNKRKKNMQFHFKHREELKLKIRGN